MISFLVAILSGFLFAIGLVFSGMSNPEKVIGFLDIFGNWDYTLLFVMGGALFVNFITFRVLTKRKPTFSPKLYIPNKTEFDKPLIIGSAIFGIGWGILGFCPGPGVVNLVTLEPIAFIFIGSMIVGILIFKLTEKLWRN